jgi:serine/threonine-protein kinase RsbW
VINAIKHGNRHDRSKFVTVEFTTTPAVNPDKLVVSIRDEGEGFEPEALADPLAPENLLKSSGRGIFFMRSFMDDVQLSRIPEGGMEVRMVKRLSSES